MATTGDQLPGCTIPDSCMLHPGQGLARRDAFCENDLKCICKADNHLGNNSLFSNECLLRECTDGHDRKLFLRNWLESCRQIGRSGWDDMPWDWEPYLPNDGEVLLGPTTLLNAPPATTPSTEPSSVSVLTSTAAVATSLPEGSSSTFSTTASSSLVDTFDILSTPTTSLETTSKTSQPVMITSHTLSPGAVGGIVTGILLLVLFFAGLGFFYWKANKKAKEKNKEVAILSDRVSGCGFQRRIDELLAESNGSTGTILRHHVPAPAELAGASASTVGVTSASSSVYSVDSARAM
ncbi:uncharacterized protein EKO05_0001026 [Ascochyta rabiei]|uniref:Uncharacterized protein n=1 Tax=Didymella rabiei TaxID=5454 RepID=A0A163EQQ2_DIDRA|nr:uncharacterized protein EKO05_0001026 [Ascochyta rabiei]KZM23851.1 hypothetical protein ST47_g5039 [Ascochyta rabiei]UPX10362.1 hypothetical protein EKO05_0001026 [Ascochyta rabiei]